MIPRVEPEGMLFGKPLHTFPDHALDDIATSHGNVTQQPHTAESRLQITARNPASPAVVASPASHALHNLSERELRCRAFAEDRSRTKRVSRSNWPRVSTARPRALFGLARSIAAGRGAAICRRPRQ